MVAAFLILLYHAAQSYSMAGGQAIAGQPPWAVVGTISMWGRVPFFFLLAGCFSARSLEKSGAAWWPFFSKRLLGLGLPYLFWNLVSLVMLYVAIRQGVDFKTDWQMTPATAVMQLTGFGMAPANGPLWFIRDLILASCLAPFLFRLGPWILVPCLLLTVHSPPGSIVPTQGVPLASSFGFFGIGMMFRFLPRGTVSTLFPRPGLGALICVTAGLSCLIFNFAPPLFAGPVAGAAGILLTGQFVHQSLPRIGEWLAANASASVLIFAANVPFFAVARRVYQKLGDSVSCLAYFSIMAFVFFFMVCWINQLLRARIPRLLPLITGGR
jgi:fucose 4-O-acetylase-like acetyltransferase